jgi:hypothetical protein
VESIKPVKLILIVTLLSALSACAPVLNGNLGAFCEGSKSTFDDHVDSLVVHGEAIINSGAGEVLVTGDQLITVYDEACGNG